MTGADRRALERFKLQLLSRIKTSGTEKNQKAIELLTRDVSAGGAFINTSEPMKIGIRVDMDLIIKMDRFGNSDDHAALVNLKGTIIRADENGMAIVFEKDYTVTRLKAHA